MRTITSPRRSGSEPPAGGEPERLQKTLARAGYGSRRKAEELIEQGRVRVGRRLARLGDRVDPVADRITVDGIPVPSHPDLRYFALNKPKGVTSTLRDRHAARPLTEFLPEGPRVFPVGRLDRESEGLLLLTNDGELANRLQHPRYGVEKDYLVQVDGLVPRSSLRRLTEGVQLEDGMAAAVHAREVQRGEGKTALSIVMKEGRKREVRRMLEAVGHPVRRLLRVRIGPVALHGLRPGGLRPLTTEEVAELYRVAGLKAAAPGRTGTSSRGAGSRGRRSGRGRGLERVDQGANST